MPWGRNDAQGDASARAAYDRISMVRTYQLGRSIRVWQLFGPVTGDNYLFVYLYIFV